MKKSFKATIGGLVLISIALFGCDEEVTCTNSDGVPKQSAQWIKSNIHASARLENVIDIGPSSDNAEHRYSVSYRLSSNLHPYGDRMGEGIWTAVIIVTKGCAEKIMMNDVGSSGMRSVDFDATQ